MTTTTYTLIGTGPGGMKERKGFRPLGNGTVELTGYLWKDACPCSRHVVPVARARQLYADYLRRGFQLSPTGQWIEKNSRRVAG